MKQNNTFYDDLNVARNAPPEVIRAAYRTLAQKHHPDRNSGDSEASKIMALLNAAFATLSDPEKRREYDKCLAEEDTKSRTTPPPQHQQQHEQSAPHSRDDSYSYEQSTPYSRNDSLNYEQRLNHYYGQQPNQHGSKRKGGYLSLLLWCVVGSIAGGIIGYFFRDYAFAAPIIGAALGLSIPIMSATKKSKISTKNDKKSAEWLPLVGVLSIAYNNKNAMNIVGGLARIFTVLHYGIGVIYLLLFSIGFTENGISKFSVFGGIGIVIAYYAYLDFEPDAKRNIGEYFMAYPIMVGISLLWTDIIVGAATGGYFFFRPFWKQGYSSSDYMFTVVLVWLAPIALLFGAWHILKWIIGGFSGRSN